jgi:hypothetical protein
VIRRSPPKIRTQPYVITTRKRDGGNAYATGAATYAGALARIAMIRRWYPRTETEIEHGSGEQGRLF